MRLGELYEDMTLRESSVASCQLQLQFIFALDNLSQFLLLNRMESMAVRISSQPGFVHHSDLDLTLIDPSVIHHTQGARVLVLAFVSCRARADHFSGRIHGYLLGFG